MILCALLLALTFVDGEAVHVEGAGARLGARLGARPAGVTPDTSPCGTAGCVMAGQGAVLECRFSLEPSETLQGVTWTKDSQLVYRWLPNGRILAFGVLENVTEAKSPGWNVHIVSTTTALAGNYSCSVHTDRGSATSRRFHFTVLLVCKARIETEDSTGVNCTVGWRVSCARVFPDLNLTAGVFDPEKNKFIDRVTEWTKVVYSDDTFGYQAFKSYHVAEIPKSSIFLWSLSYKDHTPLVTGNVSSGAVHRAWSGCPDPPPPSDVSLQVQLLYDDAEGAMVDCRGRPRGATRAVYSCANEIPDQDVSRTDKELTCIDGVWMDQNPAEPWPECR